MTSRSEFSCQAGLARPLLLVLAFVVTASFGFVVGWYVPSPGAAGELSTAELREALGHAEATAGRLTEDLDRLRARSEIDRQALEIVRSDMVEQKRYATSLEEDLRFYRSLMAPENTQGTLRVRQPELIELSGGQKFAYRIIVVQEAAKHQLVRASLAVRVLGVQGDESASFELSELSAEPVENSVPLKFRYFQEITGVLELPQGFEATAIALVLEASKPARSSLQEEFPWRLQERFSNVGK